MERFDHGQHRQPRTSGRVRFLIVLWSVLLALLIGLGLLLIVSPDGSGAAVVLVPP